MPASGQKWTSANVRFAPIAYISDYPCCAAVAARLDVVGAYWANVRKWANQIASEMQRQIAIARDGKRDTQLGDGATWSFFYS